MAGDATVRGGVERLTVADLERRLGIDRSTLWRWYRRGKFPEPEYLSERRLWRLDVVQEWERERLARPPSARRGSANLPTRTAANPASASASTAG